MERWKDKQKQLPTHNGNRCQDTYVCMYIGKDPELRQIRQVRPGMKMEKISIIIDYEDRINLTLLFYRVEHQ